MLILAFDTTSEYGGAAIYRDAECLASAANEGPASYSVTLFQIVDRLLAQTTLSLREIDLFAVANGPGSFTGIRVGVAAAQGWAKALERPVRGVSVFEAMVEAAQPDTDAAVPILDARRGEFFLSLFQRLAPRLVGAHAGLKPGATGAGVLAPAGDGFVSKPDAVRHFLEQLTCAEPPSGTVACLVREHDTAAQNLRHIQGSEVRGRASEAGARRAPLPNIQWVSVSSFMVGSIARLALRAKQEGRLQSPAELDAYYVRRSDAELKWGE